MQLDFKMPFGNPYTNRTRYVALLLFMVVSSSALNSDYFKKYSQLIGFRSSYPEDSPFKVDIHFQKYNRTSTGLTIHVNITDFIDSRYDFKFELRVWSDGGWKRNKAKYEGKDPCKQLSFIIGNGFKKVLKDLGHKEYCPLEPGVYRLENYYGPSQITPFSVFLGRQMTVYEVNKDRKQILHVEYENDVQELNTML